ncbi:MAG TPA: STAS/SEC14 domain-containing protein [Terriglobales bacterium]|nr:STAS/SEC14 domain-containing protein [Terriglobales bacterium]
MVDGFSIDVAGHLTVVKFSGHLTLQDLRAYISALRQHPDFRPEFCELVDLTDVTSTELDYSKSALLSEAADPFSLESKRAFVVVNESVDHVVRIYQTMREAGAGIKLFRTIDDARRWLGQAPRAASELSAFQRGSGR